MFIYLERFRLNLSRKLDIGHLDNRHLTIIEQATGPLRQATGPPRLGAGVGVGMWRGIQKINRKGK